MVELPTADQFPSFKDAHAHALCKDTPRCIWYLPNKNRRCKLETTLEDRKKALTLFDEVRKPSFSADELKEILRKIAELSCCPRHHRSKIIGTQLSTQVALLWCKQLNITPTPSPRKKTQPTSPPWIFARHQVHETESLREQLCSDLDLAKGTSGSIYIYTHEAGVFSDMIKIGYTCRSVPDRLLDWGTCGHGVPKQLGSILDVRHSERVERLTHFELIDVWHEMMWCESHRRTHIEWFQTDVDKARGIASRWNTWMSKAEPYDRRGRLKKAWKDWCAWLQTEGFAINSKNMLMLHEWELGECKRRVEIEEAEKNLRNESPEKISESTSRPEVEVKKEDKVEVKKEEEIEVKNDVDIECALRSALSRREEGSNSTSEHEVKVEGPVEGGANSEENHTPPSVVDDTFR